MKRLKIKQDEEAVQDRKPSDAGPVNFALIATQRTGSTFLEELLSSPDDCYVFPELFSANDPFHIPKKCISKGYLAQRSVDDFQESVLASRYAIYRFKNAPEVALGSHLMWNQVSDSLVERLIAGGYKLVLLERENILAIYRSAKFAREKGLSHVRSAGGPRERSKVEFEEPEFERFFAKISAFYSRKKRFASQYQNQAMSVTYRELAHHPVAMANSIRAFLGLEASETIRSDLQKRQSSNPLDGFSNPEHVAQTMERLGLTRFLVPEISDSLEH